MITDIDILLRLATAIVAGGLIGLERSAAGKPAGIRTQMLVCMGATLLILATIKILPDETARIIAGIATGIGFLGAGTIFRAKDHVNGLTTAASVWTVAAIGIVIGLGEYFLAIASAILVMLILQLGRIEHPKKH